MSLCFPIPNMECGGEHLAFQGTANALMSYHLCCSRETAASILPYFRALGQLYHLHAIPSMCDPEEAIIVTSDVIRYFDCVRDLMTANKAS